MNHVYLTEAGFVSLWLVIGFIVTALSGFVLGFILADNRRKADDAYNPKIRPDGEGVRL